MAMDPPLAMSLVSTGYDYEYVSVPGFAMSHIDMVFKDFEKQLANS